MDLFNAASGQIMERFNQRFAVAAEDGETSLVPLSEENDIDTLLAVKYERTTDACGCFSVKHLKFEMLSEHAIFKKKILFRFSERLGFRAWYNKKYYHVKPLDCLNNSGRLPEVTKSLLFSFYRADGKSPAQLSLGGG